MKLIAENTFYNTIFACYTDGHEINERQYNRMQKKLCGMDDCTCIDHVSYRLNGHKVALCPDGENWEIIFEL